MTLLVKEVKARVAMKAFDSKVHRLINKAVMCPCSIAPALKALPQPAVLHHQLHHTRARPAATSIRSRHE